jgi:hypothetical protein
MLPFTVPSESDSSLLNERNAGLQDIDRKPAGYGEALDRFPVPFTIVSGTLYYLT